MRAHATSQEPKVKRRVEGSTLVEVLVVLAILGVVAGVTGLGLRAESQPPRVDDAVARVSAARREAIRTGRSLTVVTSRDDHVVAATAHPDGSVVADSALALDRLSGRAVR